MFPKIVAFFSVLRLVILEYLTKLKLLILSKELSSKRKLIGEEKLNVSESTLLPKIFLKRVVFFNSGSGSFCFVLCKIKILVMFNSFRN